MFDPARYTRAVRVQARPIRVSMYEIQEDREHPERLVCTDETGARRYFTVHREPSDDRDYQRSSTPPANP